MFAPVPKTYETAKNNFDLELLLRYLLRNNKDNDDNKKNNIAAWSSG